MITFYRFTHRFKRSLLEITSDSQYVYYWNPDPLLKEKLPDNIVLKLLLEKKHMT